MAIHDLTSQRLFVGPDLAAGVRFALSAEQANYLVNVLRLQQGASLLVFNSRDGEWRATLFAVAKRSVVLEAVEQTRAQTSGPDIQYVFAPLKHARLDYMVQKATELGVARLTPVMTRHTVAERVNLDRMRANAIEAAEQCGILRVPEVDEPVKFKALIESWPATHTLIFCDEGAELTSPVAQLNDLSAGPLAVLIGPEGGFAADERELLLSKPYTVAISLGPRIMRADTAAIAALALVNATLGDWR